MNKKIRLAFGCFLLAFLFLPIAQCSYYPCIKHGPELEAEETQCLETKEVNEEIVIYEEGSTMLIMFLASIVIPIAIGFSEPQLKKWAIGLKFVELIGSVWLAALVLFIVYRAYSPLVLGHVFFIASIIYVVYSVYGLYARFKNP